MRRIVRPRCNITCNNYTIYHIVSVLSSNCLELSAAGGRIDILKSDSDMSETLFLPHGHM